MSPSPSHTHRAGAALVLGLSLSLLTASGTARADTLLLDGVRGAPPNRAAGVARPERGMPMDAVEAAFGPPRTRHEPVGDPPITRWEYPDFVVYFEHRRVLHSVVRRTRPGS